ncbi:MAG: hypothetical protein IPJ37_23575 [Bacteroidales bacterium]|nr:hypothetical protein [Bacteroidales bacterium]
MFSEAVIVKADALTLSPAIRIKRMTFSFRILITILAMLSMQLLYERPVRFLF